MVVFVCPCLNIRVHGKGNICKLENTNDLNLPISAANDIFFSDKVYNVSLDLPGTTMSQELLCKSRTIDKWIITTCMCCMMDIYARHLDVHDRVYVGLKTENDSNTISMLMNSENYSSLFKLILPEINDNFIQNNIGLEFENANIHQAIELAQNQVSSYLKEEQKAMEERIRQFTQIEQSKYTSILQKVRKSKQAMVYLLSKCKENEESGKPEKLLETTIDSSTFSRDSATESATSTDSAFDKSDASDLQFESLEKQNTKVLRRTVSNPSKSKSKLKKELKRAPASIDVGGVFDMDEFETGDPLSSYSDEYSDESESDTTHDMKTENFSHLFGTSVPMSIPGFSRKSRYPVIDDDKDEIPKNPQDIAASMRALACSVRDGTEMFGELPRRRLNTGELLASRPFWKLSCLFLNCDLKRSWKTIVFSKQLSMDPKSSDKYIDMLIIKILKCFFL